MATSQRRAPDIEDVRTCEESNKLMTSATDSLGNPVQYASLIYLTAIFGANIISIISFSLFANAIAEGLPTAHQNYGDFGFHPFMMTLAFGLFGVLAALSFRTCEHLLRLSHRIAKIVHGVLNIAALVCAILGVASMWKTHSTQTHIQSIHSWIGIVVIAIFSAQAMGGVLIFAVGPLWLRQRSISSHRLAGMMLMGLTVGSLVTGTLSMVSRITTTSFDKSVYDQMNWAACLAVIAALEAGFVFSYGPVGSIKVSGKQA